MFLLFPAAPPRYSEPVTQIQMYIYIYKDEAERAILLCAKGSGGLYITSAMLTIRTFPGATHAISRRRLLLNEIDVVAHHINTGRRESRSYSKNPEFNGTLRAEGLMTSEYSLSRDLYTLR